MAVYNTPLATERQVNFVRSLITQRDYTEVSPVMHAVIRTIKAYAPKDAFDIPALPRHLVSKTIDALLDCPRVCTDTTSARSVVAGRTAPTTLCDILATVPLAKYAVPHPTDSDAHIFCEVVERKSGQRFINRLQGAPGDWRKIWLTPAEGIKLAITIAASPLDYAKKYGEIFTQCACCGSPLSNPKSIARAMGPTCVHRFD